MGNIIRPSDNLKKNAKAVRKYTELRKKQAASRLNSVGSRLRNSERILSLIHIFIPEKIRSQFEADGFHIIMREQDITQEAYADYGGYTGIGQIQGVSDYEKKVIYLQDEYPRQIIHEMGHYINNKWGFSSRDGFKELAEKESSRISVYAGSNEREFFCEAFELYIRG